jgi:hypothetical protein
MKIFYYLLVVIGSISSGALAMKRDHEGLKAGTEAVNRDPDLGNLFLELVYPHGNLDFACLYSMSLVCKKIRTMILGDVAKREKLFENYCQERLKDKNRVMILATLRKDRREYAYLEVAEGITNGEKTGYDMFFLWHGAIKHSLESESGIDYVAGRCCQFLDDLQYKTGNRYTYNQELKGISSSKDIFSMKSFECRTGSYCYCIKKPSFDTDGGVSVLVSVDECGKSRETYEYTAVYDKKKDELCCIMKE